MIDTLRPIGLDELVTQAHLLTRVDRKYLLPAADLPALLGALPVEVRVLEIDRRREFAYWSGYFDTPGLSCYLAAARRRRRRFKVRVRGYLDTGGWFLEVKARSRRGVTDKRRVPYAGDRCRLGRDDLARVETMLGDGGIRPSQPLPSSLALTTTYCRTTLFVPATASRVTIDTQLTWTLPDGTATHLPDQVIVETKSGRSASPIDRLLWSLNHRPCSVSKYCTGLAALRPDLPANHWRPVLRRCFAQRVAVPTGPNGNPW